MSEVSELKSRIRRFEKSQQDHLDVIRDCMTELLDGQNRLFDTQKGLLDLFYQMRFGCPLPSATSRVPERQKFTLHLVKNDQPLADTETDPPTVQ